MKGVAGRLFPWLFATFLAGSAPVFAIDVAGARFADQVRVGKAQLVANGAGLRSNAFLRAYAIALYLPQKKSDAEAVLSMRGPKRIAIIPLTDLPAPQIIKAFASSIAKNSSETELAAIKDRLQEFNRILEAIGGAKKGVAVTFDWLPESGTRVSVEGRPQGEPIRGEDFYRALLRIWLGNRPTQSDLKTTLLGQKAVTPSRNAVPR